MKKIIVFCFLSFTSLYSQTDFWSHYTLNYPIRQIIEKPEGVLYAVSDTTILRSLDYGITWTKIFELPNYFYGLTLEINTNSISSYTLIAKDSHYAEFVPQISTDGGSSWQELNFTGFFRDIIINSYGDIFLLSDTLYKSIDNGLSWTYVSTPIEYYLGVHLSIDEDDNVYLNRGKRFWIYDPWGIPILTYWVDRIYRTTDFGVNWEYLFSAYDEDQIWEMFTIPQRNLFLNLYYKYQTLHHRDGNNKTYPGNRKNGAVFEENIIKYTSSLQGINYTTDNGQTWIEENTGLPNLNTYSLLKDSLGYIYTGTINGIYKSNFTTFWLSPNLYYEFPITGINDTTYTDITIVNPFSFNLSIDSVICSSEYFFVSDLNDSIISAYGSTILEVGFSPDDVGKYANFINIYTNEISGRLETFGISQKPTLIQLPFQHQFGPVYIGATVTKPISFISESQNLIRIDTIYLSIGEEFSISNLFFPITIDENDTLDVNISFSPLSPGGKSDTLVVISNCNNSPFKRLLLGFGNNPSEVKSEEVIKEYSLYDNYPNPFNPITTIEYAVPYSSFVTIKVYNLLGEEIETLINEEKAMGRYKLTFDVKNLTSGIYLYSMQAGHFNQVKKFILIK